MPVGRGRGHFTEQKDLIVHLQIVEIGIGKFCLPASPTKSDLACRNYPKSTGNLLSIALICQHMPA